MIIAFHIVIVLLGFFLSKKLNRNTFLWSLGSLLFPPVVILLIQLPPKGRPQKCLTFRVWLPRVIVCLLLAAVYFVLSLFLDDVSFFSILQTEIIVNLLPYCQLGSEPNIIKIAQTPVEISKAFLPPGLALSVIACLLTIFLTKCWCYALIFMPILGFILAAVAQTSERMTGFYNFHEGITDTIQIPYGEYFQYAVISTYLLFLIYSYLTKTSDNKLKKC